MKGLSIAEWCVCGVFAAIALGEVWLKHAGSGTMIDAVRSWAQSSPMVRLLGVLAAYHLLG